MSDQEANDRKEALARLTKDIGKRIVRGSNNTKSFASACIYRVPEDLRKLEESAYTPSLISIGPLHRYDKHLPKTMEDVKMYYANYLLFRVAKAIEDQGKRGEKNIKGEKAKLLEQCVQKMEELVDRAKKCYAEEVKVKDAEAAQKKNDDAEQKIEEVKVKDGEAVQNKNDDAEQKRKKIMAEMMLVDGCFILELLYHDKENKEAGKSTTKGGDSGKSKASSNSAPQPVNEGEDGISGGGEQQIWDPILDHILTANIVKHDLLLFENQIPFFVLDELFNLTVGKIPANKIPGGEKLLLPQYIISYFRNIITPEGVDGGSEMKISCCLPSDCAIWLGGSTNECEQKKKEPREDNPECYHILHLLHDYYVPGIPEPREDNPEPKYTGCCSPCRDIIPSGCLPCSCTIASSCCLPWRCTIDCKSIKPKKFSELEIRATDLDYAGVKFVPIGIEGNNLFDIKFRERKCPSWWFRRARFEIPTLHVHDPTEVFLRNLIAFEQCCPKITMIFTSYAKFMDMLINSEEDVQVLRKAKVIRNHLGEDKDVSELFNKLCKEVVFGGFYFDEKCQDAYKYSKHWWPKCMAYLRRTYFASPWTFIGFCLALIAFGIQITNFVRSFLK